MNLNFQEQCRRPESTAHKELEYKLERAQMMADVAGQLADQRMRRIQFELLPQIEKLESKVCSLGQRLHDILNMTTEEIGNCFPGIEEKLVLFWKKQYCDLVDRLIKKASNSPTQSISLKELYLMQNPNAHIG